MNYIFGFLGGLSCLAACLTFSNCAVNKVADWGHRSEEVTGILGAHANQTNFVIAYSKGQPGHARESQKKKVWLTTVPRALLETPGECRVVDGQPGGVLAGTAPIPLIRVADTRKTRVAPQEALLVKAGKSSNGDEYYSCSLQYRSAKGKLSRQTVRLTVRTRFLAPAAYPAMAGAVVFDVVTMPITILAVGGVVTGLIPFEP